MSDMYQDLPARQTLNEEMVSGLPSELKTNETGRTERLAICQTCPKKTTVTGVDLCTACGCVIYFKTWLKPESCPEGKW